MGASSDDRRGVIDEPTRRLDEGALRALVPHVLAGLVRRGEDFDTAEDALQEAVLEALRVWPQHRPRDPAGWLATVATRRLIDARRREAARQRREEVTYAAPVTTDGPLPETSDLVAGWWMIDVESHERAVELAAYVSSEPGPGGEPLYEWIDVREVMWERPRTTDAA